ncbi:MAG: hypothetical protein MAG453_00211 [Calditrichaeota bacterium]|nr:hypothetical protein [Calditrichota bacterium]
MPSDVSKSTGTGVVVGNVQRALVFLVPFVFSLAAYAVTRLDSVGPGTAAAWPAVMVGAGEPEGAALAPLYRLLLLALGAVVPSAASATVAGYANAVFSAATAGLIALWTLAHLRETDLWGRGSLAAWVGSVTALALAPWTAALAPNPLPLATMLLAASAVAWAWTDGARGGAAAALLYGLSCAAHAGNVLLLALIVPWVMFQRTVRAPLPLLIAGVWLPGGLFFLPAVDPVFTVTGTFAHAPPFPADFAGLRLALWSIWRALTPFGLVAALYTAASIIRRNPRSALPAAALVLLLAAGALIRPLAEWSLALAGWTVALAAGFAIARLTRLLRPGLSLLLWLLIPVLWFVNGPDVSRRGEDLWETHARNVFATNRARSAVLTTDHTRLLAPFSYLRAAEDLRGDIITFDPTLLSEPGQIRSFLRQDPPLSDSLRARIDTLPAVAGGTGGERARRIAARFVRDWIAETVEREGRGVLVSGEIDPGSEFTLIPEGLLWRVWDGESRYPFLFEGLDLGPVYKRDDPRPLARSTIALYPEMFSRRAGWLFRDGFSRQGADYVRWALRIDPSHVPSQLLAREYNIHGDPLVLRPKVWPDVRLGLPGVGEQ